MTFSEQGEDFLQGEEGLRLRAYPDIKGVWTIGWGRTKGVKQGDTCTLGQAEAWFDEDTAWAIACVNDKVKVPLTQNQFDMLVSLVYNIGCGAKGFGGSTLLELLNHKSYSGAADQFLNWKYSGGKPVLLGRRERERTIFLNGYPK